mmetsp:Transcript_48645/g.95072  ORF Transcript_48645/g.95072 Transcript_48645/m.95072 type:complete len:409 (+) Transcript_48645:156-1382(+)
MLAIFIAVVMSLLGRSASSLLARSIAAHPSRVRAVALDLDGTLCTSTGDISDGTVASLRRFAAGGGRVVIATGRGRHHSVGVAAALAERGVPVSDIVTSDGGLVLYDPSGGGGTWDAMTFCGMPSGRAVASVLERVAARVPEASFAVEVEGEGLLVSRAAYIDAIRIHNRPFFEKMMLGRPSSSGVHRPRAVPSSDFFGELRAAPRVAWVRCLDHSPGASLEALTSRVAEECSAAAGGVTDAGAQGDDSPTPPLGEVGSVNPTPTPVLVVTPSTLKLTDEVVGGVDGDIRRAPVAVTIRSVDDDKSRGLEAVCRRVNAAATSGAATTGTPDSRGAPPHAGGALEACHFVAFGDATNDLGMLRWAGRSVCPANGREDAKAAAKEVSPFTNDEDFIAEALERYCSWMPVP